MNTILKSDRSTPAPVSDAAAGTIPMGTAALDLRSMAGAHEVFTLTADDLLPDECGMLHSAPVCIPDWKHCCYYAPFQRHAINPELDLWPEGYNQCHPLPLRSHKELENAKRGGMFVIFELQCGGYLALLPLVGMQSVAWLRGNRESNPEQCELRLDVAHFGSANTAVSGVLPLLAAAHGDTPYEASAAVWQCALAHRSMRGLGKLRSEKEYPEVFEYLGWCSFEEYKLDINETIIVDALHALAASTVPVRWALIDDGHIDDGSRATAPALQTQEGADGFNPDEIVQARQIFSPHAHPEKFPNGWEPIRAAADADPRLRWLGLWLNYNGYWGGIAATHKFGSSVDAHLLCLHPQQADSAKLPGEEPEDAEVFYDAFTAPVLQAGFDFIKVDNQAANLRQYATSGAVNNAAAAAANTRRAFEEITAERFSGVIGCMAHNNLCILHQPFSQIVRCSEDYKKEDPWRARHHLHNSFGNMLWMGQTVWGDHDMFHSSDRVAGALMARSKAISGGPISLSDHPANFVQELIKPLHLQDGKILRALAPAVPTPESIFIDPYEDSRAYRIIAPLPHGCAIFAAYNLTYPGKTVSGTWHRHDLRNRNAIRPQAEVDAENTATSDDTANSIKEVLLYDTVSRRVTLLSEASAALDFILEPLTDSLVQMAPVVRGWALIGNPDKYLPAAFVTRFDVAADGCSVTISTIERGTVLAWNRISGLHQVEITDGQNTLTISP